MMRTIAASMVMIVCGCATDGGAPSADTGADETADAGPGTSPSTTLQGVTSSSSDTSESGGEAEGSSSGEPPPPVVPGLRAEYFAGYHDLVLTRIEPGLDHVWAMDVPAPEVPADRFSARFTGWITAPVADTYTIVTEADDGVRVAIGDAVVIDDWNAHFVTRNEASVALPAGTPVPIVVEYFEVDLDASLRLLWSSASLTEAAIGDDAFSTVDLSPELDAPKPPFANPVVPFDCPDPGVLAVDDNDPPGYAMACTGGPFPLRFSRDLVTWSDLGVQLLPAGKPSWAANGGRNWAPELHRHGDGLAAYFTTVDGGDTLCIGAAISDTLAGPWVESPGPLVQHDWGVIDATVVVDGVHTYLVYKIDGNSIGQPTPIIARELAPDGLSFAPGSTETQLLVNDGSTWEGGVVEAQWFVHHGERWYLFYSGNVYNHSYRTGVARADAVLGPYEKHGAPILANNERWVGPGHGTVIEVGELDYFVYHAWSNAGDGTAAPGGRNVLVDRIVWENDWPRIGDGTPSRSPQPWPGTESQWVPPTVPGSP
ncbi:MAG: family 43 glycosylhydrolase [Deltaproteobacteria bacterium]|nr:family 43 glycosylhydrolase [Nannocystaceae bacterium]